MGTRTIRPTIVVRCYTLPEHMVPDISHGRIYCKWLRDSHGIDTAPTYALVYEDGRRVAAKAYPEALLPNFRRHFREECCRIARLNISVGATARLFSTSRS